jgi:hypothetical protein
MKYRACALVSAAITACVAAPRKAPLLIATCMIFLGGATTSGHALSFDFSFTDPVNGTVTGEIDGLADNTNSQAATSVTIFSDPYACIEGLCGTGTSLAAPISVPLGGATENSFNVSGGILISGGFADTFSTSNLAISEFNVLELQLTIGEPTVADFGTLSVGGNFCGSCDSATGPLTTTPTPLPAALPLFATGLGGLGLLGWRRKRKTLSLTVSNTVQTNKKLHTGGVLVFVRAAVA